MLSASLTHKLKFNEQGLIPVVVQDATTLQVLMHAWMNADTLAETLRSKRMCYWSRSRQAFWRKGDTSGHSQTLVLLSVDCDGDTLLALVNQTGPACHTGAISCFFEEITL
ncbi:MAG: phosphoribosyl-AMP cyclohydrolase [Alphaproteobacteria bacterium]|nr:phosphoribosyl-AMP cyclohydrolase [Alphaproteobacteria bacterium]